MIGSKETLEVSKRQLFKAVCDGNIEEVIRVLGFGIDINIQDSLGQTPVFLAALCNNLSMVKKLAELGADLQVKDDSGYTILSKIVLKDGSVGKMLQNERLTIIKTLIRYGANPTTYSKDVLPIHIAIKERRNLNIVKILLTEGSANAKDIFGHASLHIAVWNNRINIVDLLIKYEHTDINQEDNKKNTPLMLAVHQNFTDIKILLLTYGANPTLKVTHEQTSIEFAAPEKIKQSPLIVMDLPESKHNILSSLHSPGPSIPEASQLRMLDTISPKSSISEMSEHSTSAILGSPKSSLSGSFISFTSRFKRTLNADSPNLSESY
ncbi:ankyrin repeat domain-containing protein [Candidatus Mesenet endosymbiont of Phosphuga atrata]|uniref:ankyrin repeat domain-containing protein n=1 Tax=Candidatus Mesenet endosymbiont of Phosphuga atrata TaxID=3066221 RepID=UPI0030D4CE8E